LLIGDNLDIPPTARRRPEGPGYQGEGRWRGLSIQPAQAGFALASRGV